MPAIEDSVVPPLACTLSAADMAPRLARIRQLTQSHLRAHFLQGSALRLSYAYEAAAELAAIVELERECCAFLTFQMTEGKDAVELLIVGPQKDGADTQWLFSQFLPEAEPPAKSAACGCGKG